MSILWLHWPSEGPQDIFLHGKKNIWGEGWRECWFLFISRAAEDENTEDGSWQAGFKLIQQVALWCFTSIKTRRENGQECRDRLWIVSLSLDFYKAEDCARLSERREPVPPWYLPTAMTCFAGFTYGNISSGEVRGSFISPPGHKVKDWHPGLPATVKRSNSALLCISLLNLVPLELLFESKLGITKSNSTNGLKLLFSAS